VTSSKDRYYVLYGSLVSLFNDDEEVAMLDEFDEVLATAMLAEMTRESF
jgi:hypothetical protein